MIPQYEYELTKLIWKELLEKFPTKEKKLTDVEEQVDEK